MIEEITDIKKPVLDNQERSYATGKRKNSIARVWLKKGEGNIIINSDKVALTGKKQTDKLYYKHTGYPGGIKKTNVAQMKEKNKSSDIIKLAIKRMIPKGPLGRQQLSNCKIYSGPDHSHQAQNPTQLDIFQLNKKNLLSK